MPWTKVAIDDAIEQQLFQDKNKGKRILTYRQALREAFSGALKRDSRVFVMGEGVDDPYGVFGSTLNLHKEFKGRVFDTPIAENSLTGFCVGAALAGMRPILVHMRMDFMLLSFDQILNHAAKICYMSGGRVSVPLVIQAIIGKGWGSAAQHSQALQALFVHMPGIKVVMPATPYDAKGLFFSSIADNNPVIFIEHRWLYDIKGYVPKREYLIPLGKGFLRKRGSDVTVLSFSLMVFEAMKAAEKLSQEGINIEVIDARSINPFDEDIVVDSIKKTGRLVIADLGWHTGGIAQIILGRIHNRVKSYLKSDVKIISLPDAPTPNSHVLEQEFYKDSTDIIDAVKETL